MDRERILGITTNDASKAFDGYTLFSPYGRTQTYLVNMDGVVVHEWETGYQPGNWGYLLENGNLLYGGNTGKAPVPFAGGGGLLMELDWHGNVVWEYKDINLHHDFSRAVNGNTMVLGWDPVPEAMTASVQGGVAGTELNGRIYADFIHEITPAGDVAWEWHAHEALDVEEDEGKKHAAVTAVGSQQSAGMARRSLLLFRKVLLERQDVAPALRGARRRE